MLCGPIRPWPCREKRGNLLELHHAKKFGCLNAFDGHAQPQESSGRANIAHRLPAWPCRRLFLSGSVSPSVAATSETFSITVAEAAADDQAIAAFYQSRAYQPLWTGAEDVARRAAFFEALDHAEDHGLPKSRYDAAGLRAAFAAVQSEHQRAKFEVAVTRTFLTYAHDVQTGFLIPSKIDAGIVREVPVRDARAMLDQFAASDPAAFITSLPPATAQYAALQKARLDLVSAIANGGWGAPVPASRLEPETKAARLLPCAIG